jgi:shikimate kinase
MFCFGGCTFGKIWWGFHGANQSTYGCFCPVLMAIFLIGMMGSGKSTVGKILADEMGLPFVDLDSFIENKENKTITEIFNQNGESYFRKLESEALAKSNSKKAVIACGGGIILSKSNRKLLQSGKVVYLKATILTLAKRLERAKNRPLLDKTDIEKQLQSIWDERRNSYETTAQIIINVEPYTPKQITKLIKEKL